MESKPVLSLCIPTNGRAEWVLPLLESIYAQGENDARFEVVVTDNAPNPLLEEGIRKLARPNLSYYRTESQGFTNQIDAFGKCRGLFCKMLNHRNILLPGSLADLLALAERYGQDQPLVFCSNGVLHGQPDTIECPSVDAFVRTLGIHCTWSAGTSIWRRDLDNLEGREADPTFPHTLFLFGLRKESRYVIWNRPFFTAQHDSGNGGYNPFEAFGVTWLDLMRGMESEGRISPDTFEGMKKNVFRFLRTLYLKEVILPTDHTFVLTGIRKYMAVHFGPAAYWKMILYDIFVALPGMVFQKIGKALRGRSGRN